MAKKRIIPTGPTNMQTSMKKATTEMMILHLLRQRSMYPYELMNEIEERSGGAIVFNTLYLSIYRLEEKGYVQERSKVMSEDNRTRIYFAITEAGIVYLEELIRAYKQYAAALARVLELE